MSAGGLPGRADAAGDPAPQRGDERTLAVWHPDMSDAAYGRLLRLLFDPGPDGGGGTPEGGKAA